MLPFCSSGLAALAAVARSVWVPALSKPHNERTAPARNDEGLKEGPLFAHPVPFPILPKPKTFIIRGAPGLILALQPEEGTVVEAFWATMTPVQSKAVTLRLAACMEEVWDLMIEGMRPQ